MGELIAHPVVAVILMLGLLVFVHEAGHYLVAKICGIGVEVFSIGFGPRLASFNIGPTLYQIAWLPLGGYVKLAGAIRSEEVPSVFKGKEMYRASPPARMAVLLAGPLANLLLATVVFMVLAFQGIEHPAPIIGFVQENGPAEQAGFEPGDRVVEIDSEPVEKWSDLQAMVSATTDERFLSFKVLRRGNIKTILVKPQVKPIKDMLGRTKARGRIGVGYGTLPAVVTILPGNSPQLMQVFEPETGS